ncbi:hypothetical protein ACGF3C_02300 [Micromonospora sp. NPDC047762]|uniref:hypothetical protein n=1 Tax=Micromonospora sp. NPDC047762 TaxID=3364255 RepID=UPI00372262F2
MAEKTIVHGSFWYLDEDGLHQTAVRGDRVDITRDEDLKRGERHGAFATDEDLAEGSDFRAFVDRRAAAGAPGVVTVDPADVEGRISMAGSADPRIQSGLIDPATVPAREQGGTEQKRAAGVPNGRSSREDWATFATTKGAPDEETKPVDEGGLSRDDLRAKYGS